MHRFIHAKVLLVIVLLAGVASLPVDAFAQRGRGQAQPANRGGGGRTAVVGGAGRSAPTGGGSGPRVAVPRGTYRPGYGHYPGHSPYYYPGHYRSFYYYPPFYGFYGWYAYPWGWWGAGWGPGWGPWYPPYGYWGPYDTSASVRIQAQPREAEVYVDGYYAGVVDDFDGTFQRLHILPGPHEITIYMAGFKSASQRMYFRPNGGYKITSSLVKLGPGETSDPKPQPDPQAASPVRHGDQGEAGEPVPGPRAPEPRWPEPVGLRSTPPPEPREPGEPRSLPGSNFGSLVVRVQPGGAAVVIDGERWQGPDGQDRLTVQLAAGTHRVEIRKDGFVPYASDVDVRAGDTTVLNVSLPPADRR